MTYSNAGSYSYLTSDGMLAQGSVPPPHVVIPFDVVVLTAIEHQDIPLPGYEVLKVPLDDSGPPPTPEERRLIYDNARRVARRVLAGKRVLVTCHQGRNRSGVIAGLALVELGVPGPKAAHRIQRIRDGLANPHFYRMVIGS